MAQVLEVYSQRYDANGVKVGAETLVNTHTSNNQYYPYIAALNDGGYIITWSSEGHQDGSKSGTYAQRYNAAGVRVGVETRINTTTASYQNVSGVTGLSDGGYVIVWFGPNDTDSSWASYAQRFDASGNTVGVQTKINTTVAGNQSHPVSLRTAMVGILSHGKVRPAKMAMVMESMPKFLLLMVIGLAVKS